MPWYESIRARTREIAYVATLFVVAAVVVWYALDHRPFSTADAAASDENRLMSRTCFAMVRIASMAFWVDI